MGANNESGSVFSYRAYVVKQVQRKKLYTECMPKIANLISKTTTASTNSL